MSATDHTPYLHLPIWLEGNVTDWFELNDAFRSVDSFAQTVDGTIMNKTIEVEIITTALSPTLKDIFSVKNPDKLKGILFVCGSGSASDSFDVYVEKVGITIKITTSNRNFVIPIFLNGNDLNVGMQIKGQGGGSFLVENSFFIKF